MNCKRAPPLNTLTNIQMKGSKGRRTRNDCLALQDYLNPYSNLNIEDQRYLFSLRCEVNPLGANFKRNLSINEFLCV